MSERRKLDRLLLPRTRTDPKDAGILTPESSVPLPRWQTLPLDAKFPVTPAAKGEVTFITTKICQPVYKSTQRENFDLSDPYNKHFKIEYQALCDPYLKNWLSRPFVRKQLMEQNLLTPSGNVTCSVRDFNNYRNYLKRQALMKNRDPETFTKAAEKRETILQQTKMKAQLLSVGVKCKGLKAQQMMKETAEEKQRQYKKKQAIVFEREQKRLEEETRVHSELVKTRRAKWTKKQNEIRMRQENLRKNAEMKILLSELEAQHKLNNVGHIRQQKQLLLEVKRKEHWQQRREHQVKAMEDTRKQQERVDAEMDQCRRMYEVKMTNSMMKSQAASVEMPSSKTEEMEKTTSEIDETITSGNNTTLKEVLYSCGLVQEAELLCSASGPDEYSDVLDKLIGSTVRRRDSASVLGEEQDMLSKIIHLVVRRLKEACSSEENTQPLCQESTADQDEKINIKRLLEEMDVSLKTEKQAHINMSSTGIIKSRKSTLKTGVDRKVNDYQHDHRARLFENHLRLSEREARQIEAGLAQYQTHFQAKSRTMEEEKEILQLFLKLACQEPIRGYKLQRRIEPTDAQLVSSVSGNETRPPPSDLLKCLIEDSEFEALRTESRHSVAGCRENLEQDFNEENGNRDVAVETVINNGETGSRNGSDDEACKFHQKDLKINFENDPENECFTTPTDEKDVRSSISDLPVKELVKDSDKNAKDIVESSSSSTEKGTHINNEKNRQHSATTEEVLDNEDNVLEGSHITRDISSCMYNNNKSISLTETYNDNEQHEVKTTRSEEPSLATSPTESSTSVTSTTWTSKHDHPAETNKLSPSSTDDETDQSTTSVLSEEHKQVSEDKAQISGLDLFQTANDVETKDVERSTWNNSEKNMNVNRHTSSPSIAGQEDETINTECHFLPWDKETNHGSILNGVVPEILREDVILDPADTDDIVHVAAQFLTKVQQRQLVEGVSIPPSRIHYLIATSLSRMWQQEPTESTDSWRQLLVNSDVMKTIGRLLSSVKIIRYPSTLLNNLSNAIACALLQKLGDNNRCLPEGVVKSIVNQFCKDLQHGDVNVQLLKDVLMLLYQEYVSYLKLDGHFAIVLFLCDVLSDAGDFVTAGKVTNSDFVENIFDAENVPSETQIVLLSSSWKVLLHQTRVAIQLSVLSMDDWTKLEDVVRTCGKILTQQASPDSIHGCIEQITRRQTVEDFKVKSAVTLSANVVAALLKTVKDNLITALTLLPGALPPRATIFPSGLDQSTTGEALVLLILNSLVRDMGEDTLDRHCLGHVAASLADLLTRDYLSRDEFLARDGLAGCLECMTFRFRYKSLEFNDSCKILSAILKPYTAFLLMDNKDISPKLQLGKELPVDEDLLSCMFSFIAEVFVTFIRGVIDKIKECIVGKDLHDDQLVLEVWRSMAILAIEAKSLLSDQTETKNSSLTSPTPTTDILEGFVDTLISKNSSLDPSRSPDQDGKDEPVKKDSDGHDVSNLVNVFRNAVLQKLPDPGYVPVPDLNIPNWARRAHSNTLVSDKTIPKKEQPHPDVEKAVRREVIIASKQIFESLITSEALEKINVNMADHVACAVFVMDRFVAGLCDKILALKNGLNKSSIAPANNIASFHHSLLKISITPEESLLVVTRVALELEPLQSSVSTICKMAESLSRIGQGMTRVNGHASSILSVIPSFVVTLLIKSIVASAIKSVAWLLNALCNGHSSDSVQISISNYGPNVKSAALDIVCGVVELVRNCTEKETSYKKQVTLKRNPVISEDSILTLQVNMRNKVFAQISDLLESLRTTADDDNIDCSLTPTDLVIYVINQVFNSMAHRVEAGTFPFVHIKELLRNERPTTAERLSETTNVSGNIASLRSKNKMRDPLTALREEESECVFRQLVHIFTAIDKILKENLTAAVKENESYDSLLRASALMNFKLEKVKNDLAKKKTILVNLQQGDTHKLDMVNASNQLNGNNCTDNLTQVKAQSKYMDTFYSNEEDNGISISRYMKILFQNITDTDKTNEMAYASHVRVIHEILKACYVVEVNCLIWSPAENNNSVDLNLESIFLTEAVIVELYNRLDQVKIARTKKLDKKTNYPYLFSRKYTKPDPCGPFYSDVVLRARQISDTVKIGGDISNKCRRLSEENSLVSSREGSLIPEFIQGKEECSEVVCKSEVTESEAGVDEERSVDMKVQARVTAWRRHVKDSSTVHSADTIIKTWVKKGTRPTLEHSKLNKDSGLIGSEGRSKVCHQSATQNIGKLGDNQPRPREQKSCSAERVCKDHLKPQNNNSFSLSKVGLCSNKFSSPKETIGHAEEGKETLKQAKGSTSKTTWKLNEAAEKRHISRITRKYGNRKNSHYPKSVNTEEWPRTVHIIHHAYAEQPCVLTTLTSGSNSSAAPTSLGNDHVMNICPVEAVGSENELVGNSDIRQEVGQGQLHSMYAHLLISLLASEMPQEAAIVSRIMCDNPAAILETNALVDFLSLLDLVQIELGQGDEVEIMRRLKGEGHKEKVSQRAAGAINNVLRSIMTDLIDDRQIKNKVLETGTDLNHIDVTNIKQELVARLLTMAERVEQGCQAPDLLLDHEASLLKALRDVREITQNVGAECPNGHQHDDGADILDEYISDSPTLSCSKVHQSNSDADSNDDKCIISSSWTILSSCPSLSSSRSSNVAKDDAPECGQEEDKYGQLSEEHPRAEIASRESEDNTQQSAISSTTRSVCHQEDEDCLSGRGSQTRKDNKKDECSGKRYVTKESGSHNDEGHLPWQQKCDTNGDDKLSNRELASNSSSTIRQDSKNGAESHRSRQSYCSSVSKTPGSSRAHSSRGVSDEISSRASCVSSPSSAVTQTSKSPDPSKSNSQREQLNESPNREGVTKTSQMLDTEDTNNGKMEACLKTSQTTEYSCSEGRFEDSIKYDLCTLGNVSDGFTLSNVTKMLPENEGESRCCSRKEDVNNGKDFRGGGDIGDCCDDDCHDYDDYDYER